MYISGVGFWRSESYRSGRYRSSIQMERGGDRGRVGYSRKYSGRVVKKKVNAGKETRAGAEICRSVFSSGASREATIP